MRCELIMEKRPSRKTGRPNGWTCEASSLEELASAVDIHLNLRDRGRAFWRRDGSKHREPAKIVREDGREFPVRQLVAYNRHGWAHPKNCLVTSEPAFHEGANPHVLPDW